MPRMLWFGLLFATVLLVSFTGFIDADADADEYPNSEEETGLPNEDDVKKTIKLYAPRFADPVSIHEDTEVKEYIPVEIPDPTFTFEAREEQHELLEADKLMEDDHHLYTLDEVVAHMKKVAEHSEQEMKETDSVTVEYMIQDDQEDDTSEHYSIKEDDVVVGELVEEYFEEKDDDALGKEKADDKRKEALSNVEMLRRSDRSAVAGEKPKKRVYIKVIPPEHEINDIYDIHEHEEEEDYKHEVVFLDPDSHAHVVHISKDHARVSVQHDDFTHDEM